MDEEPFVSESARRMIGTAGPWLTGSVSARESQRYAMSVGDLNPLYFDEDAAVAAGYAATVMPPMCLTTATRALVPLHKLRADGNPIEDDSDVTRTLPLPVTRRMVGGLTIDFHAPIHPGVELKSQQRLVDIEEKDGRSGRFIIMSTETEYRTLDDELIATVREKRIAR